MPVMHDIMISHSQSLGAIAVLVLLLLGVYFVLRCIYQLYFSPLSSVPGPWHTCISNLWITSHVIRMQKAVAIQQLFDIYGPVVRIGPGKVAFRDYAAMKDVYTSRKFDKSEYYESFVLNDDKHTFCVIEEEAHSIHRKKYASHYTPTNLVQFQPEVYDTTHELIDGIYGFAETKTPVECLAMVRHLMVDVLVNSSHGYHAGSLSMWASGVDDPLSVAISDFPLLGVIRHSLPDWMWPLVSRIPSKRWNLLCTSDKILAKFVIARLDEMRARLAEGKIDSSDKWMVVRLLERQGSSAAMSQTDIISETVGHMIAGSDTTSISLSFSLWVLSQRRDIMAKLQQEIDQVMPDAGHLPDTNTLHDLPYLNAVIKEGLRLFGAVPSILERVVPAKTTCDLMGYNLPPGTVVGTQGWSVHRDPLVFDNPSAFEPERWLQTPHNHARLTKMNQHFMAFGLGSRACVGQRLAMMVMRAAIASIVRNFDISAPPETTAQSMTPKESFARHLRYCPAPPLTDLASGNFPRLHEVQAQLHPSPMIWHDGVCGFDSQ